MTTEQRIREAFEKYKATQTFAPEWVSLSSFEAGYMALLNELEPLELWQHESGMLSTKDMTFNAGKRRQLFALPEGVTK